MAWQTPKEVIIKKLEVVGEITRTSTYIQGASAVTVSGFFKDVYKAVSEAVRENDYPVDDS